MRTTNCLSIVIEDLDSSELTKCLGGDLPGAPPTRPDIAPWYELPVRPRAPQLIVGVAVIPDPPPDDVDPLGSNLYGGKP
jgi:hypothetical protein